MIIMAETIELFGKKVDIKNSECTLNGAKPTTGHMMLDLYIKINDMCNAKCSVCSNHGNEKKSEIDYAKLKYVIEYLEREHRVNRIAITGGEPFLDMERLNNVLNIVFEAKPNAFVTINTNGFRIKDCLDLDSISKVGGIHISRHHFDDSINNKFFGIKTASISDIDEVVSKIDNPRLIRLNCLLMKSYIHDIKGVEKYLEMASELDVHMCGFVSLMPINEESKKEFIDFNDIFTDLPSKFQKISKTNDLDICECTNGVYLADNGVVMPYYARMTKELNCPYARQFVYTSDNHLTGGFNKGIIL